MLQFPKNTATPKRPGLLELVRSALRTRHYSPRTGESYIYWIQGVGYFYFTSISPDSNSNCYFRILPQNKLSNPLKRYILFHRKRNPAEIRETGIYTHVMNKGGMEVKSPADLV
jgi:hypothetical protein